MTHDPKINPYKMWMAGGEEGKVVPIFPEGMQGVPRQECSMSYVPVAIAYVTRANLIRAGRLWGDDVRMSPFPLERATDIDTAQDLEHAAFVLKKFDLI
jgi:CMP-N-acetylneuraminic acid synthetase